MNLKVIEKQQNDSAPNQDERCRTAFDNSRDPDFYFPAAGHRAALEALTTLMQDGNESFALLTGLPGTGKTYLRTLLYRALDPARFVRVSIESSLLDFDPLLLEMISQISGRRATAKELPDRYARLSEFKRLLAQNVARSGRHLAILIDEAQGLEPRTLEALRLLSNISTEQRAIMSFVLFGSNALVNLVEESPELLQRVALNLHLKPFDQGELQSYVGHRLDTAHSPLDVKIPDSAWSRIQSCTGGVPRRINRCLQAACQAAETRGVLDEGCFTWEDSVSGQFRDDPALLS